MSILNRLPKNWNLITIDQYLELKSLEQEELSGTSLVLEQLAVLLDTDSTDPDIENLDVDDLFTCLEQLQFLSVDPPSNSQKLQIEYEPIELNELVLGEFIDLEHYIEEPLDNLKIILAILFKKRSEDEWNNIIYEPYIYDINQRAEKFGGIPITSGMYWLRKYQNWKKDFLKTYENLFEDADTGKEIQEEKQELSGYENIEYQKELRRQQTKAKFSWENTIYGLANGDITKFNDVFAQKAILVFNVLGMKKTFEV
jgi:hypothetical protein